MSHRFGLFLSPRPTKLKFPFPADTAVQPQETLRLFCFLFFFFFPSYHIFFFNCFDSLMFYLAPGKTDLHHYRAAHTHFAKTNNNHARRQTGEKPDSVHQYGIPSALKGRGMNQENCGTAEQNTGLYYWQNVCHTPNVNISVQKHGLSHKAVPHI